MIIKRIEDNITVSPEQIIRVKKMGNITELFYQQKKSKGGSITKIDKDTYIDNNTGEIKEFNHIKNRSQDMDNIKKSMQKLRDLLNTNIINTKNVRWVTITYKENITDTKKLYNDFKNCIKKLREIYGHFEYINCIEPQGRGAWHCHIVFIFENQAPFIDSKILSKCWANKGFVTIKRLDDVDNVGAYLTAYLGDVELTKENTGKQDLTGQNIKEVEVIGEDGKPVKKKFIKGARLHMYPPGVHLYRCSKGIKKPVILQMKEQDAQKEIKASGASLTFKNAVSIENPEKDFQNTLFYRYYNTLRRNKNK